MIKISGVANNKMQSYYFFLPERSIKVSVIVSNIQCGTLQIAETLTAPTCNYLVIQYKVNIVGQLSYKKIFYGKGDISKKVKYTQIKVNTVIKSFFNA